MALTAEIVRRRLYLAPLRLRKAVLAACRRRVGPPQVVFLLGAQRSGTNMVLDVLERSADVAIYNESHHRAFADYRYISLTRLHELAATSRLPVVVFKPLKDSQRVELLRREFPDAKVVWAYRRFQDVVNSNIHRWRDALAGELRSALAHGDTSGWVLENVAPSTFAELRRLAAHELSDHELWSLFWYLRNAIFFDRHLDEDPERVLLVCYEELVQGDDVGFRELFDFLGLGFRDGYRSRVFASSVDKEAFPAVDPAIRQACEQLSARLDQCRLRRRRDWAGVLHG